MIKGIALPHSDKSLLNGHFVDDSFLTMAEDEQSINTTLKCLNTFCLAFGSSIQWNKTSCYRQSFKDIPQWLINFSWKWIQPGETFKFLSIPFAFEASPAQLWKDVVQKVKKKVGLLVHKETFPCKKISNLF